MAAKRAGAEQKVYTGKDRRRVLDPICQQVLDGIQLGVVVLRLEDLHDLGSFRILSANPAAAQLAGAAYALDGAVGKTVSEAFPDVLRTDLPRQLADIVASGVPHDLGDVWGLGSADRVYSAKTFPLPGDCVGVVFDDVTRQRRTDKRIRRSESQLARAQQLGRMGSWVWEIPSDRLTWSEELYRIYGVSPETFSATFAGYLALVHPDDRCMVEGVVRGALERAEAFHFRERIVRPGGEVRVLDSQGGVAVNDDGVPIEMFGICRDITEESRTESALIESERRFAKTVQASPVAVCIIRVADGRLIEANPRFVQLVRYGSRQEVIGQPAARFGLLAPASRRDDILAQLRAGRSVSETAVTYVTRGGEGRRAIAADELIEVGGEECILKLLWWSERPAA